MHLPMHLLLIAALVGSWLLLALAPDQLWVATYAGTPPLRVAIGLGLAAVLVVALGGRREPGWRWTRNLAVAAVLLATYLGTRVVPLGDYGLWNVTAATDQAGASELLANATYRLAALCFGPAALPYVAPAFGFAFALAMLRLCDRRFPRHGRLCGLAFLGGGWHVLFFRGYIENTQLALPFLVLATGALTSGARRDDARPADAPRPCAPGDAALARGAFWLAVAGAFHGSNVALLPALPLLAAYRHPPFRHSRAFLRSTARALGVVVATVAAAVACLWALGFELHLGHVAGGSDHSLLVPLDPPPLLVFGMFWKAHFVQIANDLMAAAPLALVYPLLLPVPRVRARLRHEARRRPALVVLPLGFLGFVTLIYFDLLFPRDWDLMVAMGMPLWLYCLSAPLALARRGRGAVLLGDRPGAGGRRARLVPHVGVPGGAVAAGGAPARGGRRRRLPRRRRRAGAAAHRQRQRPTGRAARWRGGDLRAGAAARMRAGPLRAPRPARRAGAGRCLPAARRRRHARVRAASAGGDPGGAFVMANNLWPRPCTRRSARRRRRGSARGCRSHPASASLTLQAVMEDAAGRRRATNAVIIRAPPAR